MLTLSRPDRFAIGVFLPAPLFTALMVLVYPIGLFDEPGAGMGSLVGEVVLFVMCSLFGCLLVGLPAGLCTALIERLQDRGASLATTLAVGALLGAGCGALMFRTATQGGFLAMAAVVGLVVAWLLRALRGPAGSDERGVSHQPEPLP